MSNDIHSTGRGGAGNIGHDPETIYVDGDIVREGAIGQSNRGGRGGAGNITDSPRVGPSPGNISEDVIPETAMRTTPQPDYHTGRGGGGNVHKDKHGGHSSAKEARHEGGIQGLAEKVKHIVGLDKEKPKTEGS